MPPGNPLQSFAVLLLAFGLGCARNEPPAPPPQRVESPAIGIAIAGLPAGFEVVSAQAPTLELRGPDNDVGSTAVLTIEATEELDGGINLVAAAEDMKEWFERQPEGRYFGNLELGTPHGPAFTARGSYRSDAGEIEELRVFTLHPTSNRMLRLTYRYPPGEGKSRLEQLALVLGEIEAL